MDPNLKGEVPGVWEQFYEAAITEPDRTKRMERLIEAKRAVLERALVLEKEGGNNPAEGQALQEAAVLTASAPWTGAFTVGWNTT